MTTTTLSLDEIYNLAYSSLTKNGCDEYNAEAVSTTVKHAERDGSVSHGLFRIPGYVASLKSKKVKVLYNGVQKLKLFPSKKKEVLFLYTIHQTSNLI